MKKLLAGFILMLVVHQVTFGLAVPLSVKNSLPSVSRTNVPVQMGIPFPQGKLQVADVPKLTISDSLTGYAVPAGIKSTVLWHDGSVRWVRAVFPATVAANSRSSYILTDANLNPDGGIQATESNNTVTVITGPLKFVVKGTNFNLIDEAWVNEANPGVFNDDNKVITSGNTGGFLIRIANVFYNSNSGDAKVTLYEKTNYHVIVKVVDTLNAPNFPYTLFIYAYANKPYIKVVSRYYYNSNDGTSGSVKNVKDIALLLRTNITGGKARISTLDADTAVTLGSAATDSMMLNYDTPDHFIIKGESDTLATGAGMNGTGSAGPANIGWGHLSNNTTGVAGAIRFIWQMAPKNISLLGTGDVELHLFSPKAVAMPIYGGSGRIHFAGFCFSKEVAMAKEMFYAVTQPLYAIAPAKWLTMQTKVMGNLAPCDASSLNVTAPSMIAQYKNMGTNHGHADRKKIIDGEHSYGYLGFGDLSDPPETCGGRHWSNNYYDFPHCIAQGFMVTASEANIETGLAHAMQLVDMDHSSVTGQSRTGPGYGVWGDYTSCAIGYSSTANHYKCMGAFDWSNILAEPILGEAALKVAAWATTYPGGQARSIGHVLEALSAAYAYTNLPTWQTYLATAFTRFNLDSGQTTLTGDQPFQQAYVGEGICWALLELPNLAVGKRALKYWADNWASKYDMSSTNIFEHTFGDYPDLTAGFFPGISGALDRFPENDTLYKRVLGDVWSVYTSAAGQGNVGDGRLKTFTQKFKGAPHYFHHALKSGYDPLLPDYASATSSVIAVEAPKRVLVSRASLSAHPNPTKAGTIISYTIPEDKKGQAMTLSIFNPAGRLIANIENGLKQSGAYSVEWDGKDLSGSKLPSGVYLLALKIGKERLNKQLVLIR